MLKMKKEKLVLLLWIRAIGQNIVSSIMKRDVDNVGWTTEKEQPRRDERRDRGDDNDAGWTRRHAELTLRCARVRAWTHWRSQANKYHYMATSSVYLQIHGRLYGYFMEIIHIRFSKERLMRLYSCLNLRITFIISFSLSPFLIF